MQKEHKHASFPLSNVVPTKLCVVLAFPACDISLNTDTYHAASLHGAVDFDQIWGVPRFSVSGAARGGVLGKKVMWRISAEIH